MLEFYTDGACVNNGTDKARSSWAFVVVQNGRKVYENCAEIDLNEKQSNNVGELMAIRQAIAHAYSMGEDQIVIYSDSKYAINSLTIWDIEKQIKGQKKKNYELIKEIQALIGDSDIEFVWVKGHNNNYYNDIADNLAQQILS